MALLHNDRPLPIASVIDIIVPYAEDQDPDFVYIDAGDR